MSMELVRLATTGSVDDGKSTLIGRMLYDTKQIFRTNSMQSSWPARTAATTTSTLPCSPTGSAPSVNRASPSMSPTGISPHPSASSFLPTRPGHIQYTRNMVTGAQRQTLLWYSWTLAPEFWSRPDAIRLSLRCCGSLILCCVSTRWTSLITQRIATTRSLRSSPSSPPGSTFTTCASFRSALKGDNIVEESENTRGTTGHRCCICWRTSTWRPIAT